MAGKRLEEYLTVTREYFTTDNLKWFEDLAVLKVLYNNDMLDPIDELDR